MYDNLAINLHLSFTLMLSQLTAFSTTNKKLYYNLKKSQININDRVRLFCTRKSDRNYTYMNNIKSTFIKVKFHRIKTSNVFIHAFKVKDFIQIEKRND